MAFLRSTTTPDHEPDVRGRGIVLRAPVIADYAAWLRLRGGSRDHLVPWEPQWAADELTRMSFRRRLRQYQHDQRADLAYAFFIRRTDDDELLGGLTLSNVRRGVSQAASLGYWMGLPYAGRGYMSEAVRAVLPHAFEHLRLHRVEAACLPSNSASIRVLEKCGFVPEGLARRFLKINGNWQDHLLFARIEDDGRHEVAQ